MTFPDDFLEVRGRIGTAFARAEVSDWVQTTLSRDVTLHQAAARDPHHRSMRGRGTVYLIEADGGQVVVRRYLRGGGMRILGDRYLRIGDPRPMREVRASDEAAARGIRTPRVLALAVYPAGLFYRADLVTAYIPDSITLAELLFEQAAPSDERRRTLEAVGRVVRRLAAAGIRHTDLNARNILLQRSDEGVEPAVLDLDRMVVNRDGRVVDPATMLVRLERSLRKLTPDESGRLSPSEWRSLREGAGIETGGGQWPPH